MTEIDYRNRMKRLIDVLPKDKSYYNSDGMERNAHILEIWANQGFMPLCMGNPDIEIQCRMRMANEIYKRFLNESRPKTYKLVCTWTLDTWSPK